MRHQLYDAVMFLELPSSQTGPNTFLFEGTSIIKLALPEMPSLFISNMSSFLIISSCFIASINPNPNTAGATLPEYFVLGLEAQRIANENE